MKLVSLAGYQHFALHETGGKDHGMHGQCLSTFIER